MSKAYTTQPKNHRSGVTQVDSANPADASGAVDCKGYKECRFDVSISGTGVSSIKVQALFWNSRLGEWFGGGKYTFDCTGNHSISVDAGGAKVFLKVIEFSGTSFSLAADYTLS